MMAASLLFILIFCTLTLSISSGSHGKLGEQSDPSVETDALDAVPQPLVFYEEFVKENKPVVFRSAVKNSRLVVFQFRELLGFREMINMVKLSILSTILRSISVV